MARKAGEDRGLFERPAGSGVWWVQYFDREGRRHREKVGSKSAARKSTLSGRPRSAWRSSTRKR